MKLSFVITCYNYEAYVAEAIEGALAQTHPNIEIIVVDDGSSDRSREVIAAFGDRVRTIHQQNAGHVAATNAGYALATGDIVVFLDADDRVAPTMAQKVVEAWRPGLAKVQYELAVIDADSRPLGRLFCDFPAGYSPADVAASFEKTGAYISPVNSGNAYGRAYLDALMPLRVARAPDGALNILAPLYGEVLTLTEPLGDYRLHGMNLSRQGAAGRTQSHPPFGRRIGFRMAEFDLLRRHADRLGVALPKGNLLDNELVFVNYRLAALKLGDAYPGQERDHPLTLWATGLKLVLGDRRGVKFKLKQIAWFTALLLSFKPASKALIEARFSRGQGQAPA